MRSLPLRGVFPSLALILALGCSARNDLPCAPGAYECEACKGVPGEAPKCRGTGLIWSSTDECIDDGGESGTGDLLEVYCVNNLARFCLSFEDCPWRDGATTEDAVSCSNAGLHSSYMAEMINGCEGWEGHDRYCCSEAGKIGFAGR